MGITFEQEKLFFHSLPLVHGNIPRPRSQKEKKQFNKKIFLTLWFIPTY